MTRSRFRAGGEGAGARLPHSVWAPSARVGLQTWTRLWLPALAWALLAALAAGAPSWAANAEDARLADEKTTPVVAPAQATEDASAKAIAPPSAGSKARATAILYVPPTRGSARHTAGAGTRGVGSGKARVAVLAPADHVGLTTRASPTLYWNLSEATTTRIEITVVDDDAIEPVVGLSLPAPVAAGIHALDLESLGVVLAPDKTYRWFVALVHDAHRRSKDELAEGTIERITVPVALESEQSGARAATARAELAGRDGEIAALRAESLTAANSGLWYDALAAVSSALERDPSNPELRADRAALLAQARIDIEVR